MADYFNTYELKTFAATVADCMDFPLPETYAPGLKWVSNLLKERMGDQLQPMHTGSAFEV